MDAGAREVAAIVNARAEKRNEPLRLRSAPASINVQSKHVHEGEDGAGGLCQWYSGAHEHCGAALERTMDPTVLGYANFCAKPN